MNRWDWGESVTTYDLRKPEDLKPTRDTVGGSVVLWLLCMTGLAVMVWLFAKAIE